MLAELDVYFTINDSDDKDDDAIDLLMFSLVIFVSYDISIHQIYI